MTDTIIRIAGGALGAVAIASVAWRARSLSPSGAIAAAIIGTVAAAAGWDWAILLIAYFVSSTFLSRAGRRRKLARTEGMIAKAGARDAWQVMSNGLPFALAAIAAGSGPGSALIVAAAGAGSLAASAADTWATEIGTLFGQRPRSILTGRLVAVGESGGVSLAGTIASLAGALFVGLAALALGWPGALTLPVVGGGVAGSIADSIAGAAVQRRSWCDVCGRATEMRVHTCGNPSRHTGGIPFVENDAVNLAATVVGAVVAMVLARNLA